MTVSLPATAEDRVSITVAPEIETPPEATLRRAPFTVTRKAPGAGTKSVSRASSKLAVSVASSTDALTSFGRDTLPSTLWLRS